ncbi:MAG TPA: DUF3467 domain-containing protein [Thermoguttaceae bacterium]|nr:DUF3467 domain-containing protein [Thermoguttaceae bacterium]
MGFFNWLSERMCLVPPPVFDDSSVSPVYADFVHLGLTSDSLVINFGLLPHTFPWGRHPAIVLRRVAMDFRTARKLLAALKMTIQEHERILGSIGSPAGCAAETQEFTSSAEPIHPTRVNLARVTGTPDEVVFDFVCDWKPFGNVKVVHVSDRVVTSFRTTKGLFERIASTI